MNAHVWRKSAPAQSFDLEDDEPEEDEDFFAGDRICDPSEETRGSLTLRLVVAGLIAAGGWWAFNNAHLLQGWLPKFQTASVSMDYRSPPPVAPATTMPEHPSPAAPAPAVDAAPALAHTPDETPAVEVTA